MWAYFQPKFIVLLPQDVKLLNYTDMSRFEVRVDAKNSHGSSAFGLILIQLRSETGTIELSRVRADRIKGLIGYIKSKNIPNL